MAFIQIIYAGFPALHYNPAADSSGGAGM